MVSRSLPPASATSELEAAGGRGQDGLPRRSILMLAPSWPYPPTWGFAVRVHQLARQLSARHEVTLLTYAGGNATGEDRRTASWFSTAHLVPMPPAARQKRRAQLISLVSPRSYHMSNLSSKAMRRAVERALAERSYDIVQVESSQMAEMVPDCDAPVVLDEHNVEFMLLSRIARTEPSAPRRWFGALESAKARREEIEAWRKATGVVFASTTDLSVMHRIDPGKRAKVVANGVDVQEFAPRAEPPEQDLIVFTGSINYRPNTDAVAYFNRHIFPAVRKLRPSARFLVVGQGVPDWLVRSAPAGVEFTGFVPDVKPYLARAAVVVVPLRSGSGTRLKILEALAMGRPVVTTAMGCEGLRVVDGQHVCVADEPESFAGAVDRLLSDPRSAAELGEAGRQLVKRDYSWDVAGRRLEQFHTELIGKETRV